MKPACILRRKNTCAVILIIGNSNRPKCDSRGTCILVFLGEHVRYLAYLSSNKENFISKHTFSIPGYLVFMLFFWYCLLSGWFIRDVFIVSFEFVISIFFFSRISACILLLYYFGRPQDLKIVFLKIF